MRTTKPKAAAAARKGAGLAGQERAELLGLRRSCFARTQAPPPVTPDQAPSADPGMIPLTVPEIRRLLAALQRPHPPGHAVRWLNWRRRHQARARWFRQRTRLDRDNALIS